MEARDETLATEEDNTIMVNRLKALREQAHLTQREVAKLLDVDEPTVSRWESGRRPLPPEVIEKLARVFKVSSWQLFLARQDLRAAATGIEQADGEERDDDSFC